MSQAKPKFLIKNQRKKKFRSKILFILRIAFTKIFYRMVNQCMELKHHSNLLIEEKWD